MEKLKKNYKVSDIVIFSVTTIAALLYIFPVFFAFISSIKTNGEILKNPLALPKTLNFSNFLYLFQKTKFPAALLNSFLLTTISLALIIIIVPMAAYGIERKRSKVTNVLYLFFIAGMMIPFQAYMIPLFKELKVIGVFGTLMGPILVYIAGSCGFGIVLFTSFIRGIPLEIEEAAAIDGCNRFKTFWQIVFPLLGPCTASLIVLNGLSIWNDFLMPMLVLKDGKAKTINVEIFAFVDQFASRWDIVFAGTVCAIIPILILFFSMQKYFVKGITAGAVKG